MKGLAPKTYSRAGPPYTGVDKNSLIRTRHSPFMLKDCSKLLLSSLAQVIQTTPIQYSRAVL